MTIRIRFTTKAVLMTAMILFMLISCQQVDKGSSYSITGTITDFQSGTAYINLKSTGFADTAFIENGKFTFTGKVDEPTQCAIGIKGISEKKVFYLENSEISFKADINSLDKAIIEGSRLESDKQKYDSLLHLIDIKYDVLAIDAEYETANDIRKEEILQIFDLYEMDQVYVKREFIKDNPGSYLSPIILWDIDWAFKSASEFDEYANCLDPSLNGFSYLEDIKEIFDRLRKVDIGKIAPDFTMNDFKDKPVTMSNICTESKYVLIVFWSSTCGPCRIENPNIVKAFNSFHNKGLNIIGVSTDTDKEDWLNAIEQDGLVWTNVCNFKKWNDNEIVQLYALRQQSENILVDSTRRIIAKNIKGEELHRKLEELMNQ